MSLTIQQIQDNITNKTDAREIINQIADYIESNPSGGSSYLVKTYAELIALINGNGLVTGTQYQISDYATKHFIVDGIGTQFLGTIITGVNEPLILTANSTNTLDKEARSALHPEDIIYYDWNPDNWIDDLSFSDLSGTPTIITGFKGVIYFRYDTLLDNYCGYDFRNCKFRRWKTNAATWDSGTAYTAGQYVTHSSKIYKSLQAGTNKQPDTQTAYWVNLIDLTTVEYWNNNPTATNGIPSNAAEFNDFKTFAPLGTDTYETSCSSNHFGSFKDNNTFHLINATILSNNIFYLFSEGFYTVYSNEIATANFGNTIGGAYFSSNSIGAGFYNNSIGASFYNNSIGANFYNNSMGAYFANNSIGANFYNNSMGAYFYNNSIGANFHNNSIGENFYNNSIGENFYSNSGILSYFNINDIKNSINTIDFSTATHVYSPTYNKTIFKRQDGTAKLSYFNNSDVLTVVAANA